MSMLGKPSPSQQVSASNAQDNPFQALKENPDLKFEEICEFSNKYFISNNNLQLLEDSKGLRELVPQFYNIKLPDSFMDLILKVNKIDDYLISQKNRSDTFENIQNFLKISHDLQITEEDLKKINYLIFNYYDLRRDPFNNLILVIPAAHDKTFRKNSFRERINKYFIFANMKGNEMIEIPERELKTKKTIYFFSTKKFLPKKQDHPLFNDEFFKNLTERFKEKLKQFQDKYESVKAHKIKKEHLQEICSSVIKLYEEKKTESMFKATVIDHLTKTLQIHHDSIVVGMTILINIRKYLMERHTSRGTILNFRTNRREKLVEYINVEYIDGEYIDE